MLLNHSRRYKKAIALISLMDSLWVRGFSIGESIVVEVVGEGDGGFAFSRHFGVVYD